MHHRPPILRSTSTSSASSSTFPRLSPLLPSSNLSFPMDRKGSISPTSARGIIAPNGHSDTQPQQQPSICGLPLKYVSLVTLAVQNASLSIVMHYSRVSTPAHLAYSPASAVLLNEILKGSISLFIALRNSPVWQQHETSCSCSSSPSTSTSSSRWRREGSSSSSPASPLLHKLHILSIACQNTVSSILSPDCWKLSIPAILYVIQNSLQFVAISNLPVATFQVTYQMKILTTAAFSVGMMRKRLGLRKWLALVALAVGVGIVQIQNSTSSSSTSSTASPSSHNVGSAHEFTQHVHMMNPLKGFAAVTAACFTSGLAGVYFEMVLKNSKADLWIRNVQLSMFSLLPAVLPIVYHHNSLDLLALLPSHLLQNFGFWAWATVWIQVAGGLVTAIVIKYSDNIMKGFATSLSIVLSFLASVALFDFRITASFLLGSAVVLGATWVYNMPEEEATKSRRGTGFVATPVGSPLLGEVKLRTVKS